MGLKVNIFIVVVFCFLGARVSAQEGGVKSNLLYDVTGTLNFGMEFSLDYEWTLDVSANYNAWNFSPTRKMKHWLLQPELRWWGCEPFSGHFSGFMRMQGSSIWGECFLGGSGLSVTSILRKTVTKVGWPVPASVTVTTGFWVSIGV